MTKLNESQQRLFKAFKRFERGKCHIIATRPGGRFGITVSDDDYAIEYRRLDRLSRLTEAKIDGVKICRCCAMTHGLHLPDCQRQRSDRCNVTK